MVRSKLSESDENTFLTLFVIKTSKFDKIVVGLITEQSHIYFICPILFTDFLIVHVPVCHLFA